MAEPIYEVVWPLGKSVYQTVSLARRDQNLDGQTVCELWDRLFRGDLMFDIIRESLSKRYPDMKFVGHTVFGNISGSVQRQVVADLPNSLHKHGCSAVISAVGA